MTSKIIKIDEIKNFSESFKYSLAYGHFTTIHPGHIRYLQYAKSQADDLIIAIIGDENDQLDKPKFQFNQEDRSSALAMLDIAKLIIKLQAEELDDLVRIIQPKVIVLGKEKEYQQNLDIKISKAIKLHMSYGGLVKFASGDIQYASTELLSSPESDLREKKRIQFRAACKRQNIKCETLLESINQWKNAKLIIIGDIIVDQYAACEALGMSAEAPVVVVKELKRKNFVGGAGIVASHISSLGANCELCSVIGDDENANIVIDHVNSMGIGNHIIKDPTRPTTFKKRYLVENQKLFRVSRLEDQQIPRSIEARLIEQIATIAKDSDGIVISDFVYGVITDNLLKEIKTIAKKYNLMLFGDIQCSSQIGSITKFKNFSLLCPNEREARVALQDKTTGLELLSQELINNTSAERLIMKLGAEGFIAYDRDSEDKILSQAFPALSVNPVDVSGAGDSLLAVMSTGMSSGESMMTSAALATCMTALAVENMGNKPITAEVLITNILNIFKN